MVWDFAESNPFSNSSGNWMSEVDGVAGALLRLPQNVNAGSVSQDDASETIRSDTGPVIVTDPPYYANIGYADLSDFFYVWLRPILRNIYPDVFAGISTPKSTEMIAAPRFANPRDRFSELMSKSLRLIRERCSPEFPIFYFLCIQATGRAEERQVFHGMGDNVDGIGGIWLSDSGHLANSD